MSEEYEDQEYKDQVAKEERIREVLADPNTATESNRVVEALKERGGHVNASTSLICDVHIKTAEQRINGTECYLNGVKVAKMFNVEFAHPVGNLPRVTLSVYPTQLEMKGKAYVEILAFCPNCRSRMDDDHESIRAKLESPLGSFAKEETTITKEGTSGEGMAGSGSYTNPSVELSEE